MEKKLKIKKGKGKGSATVWLSQMGLMQAIVKSVLSGDTLVLHNLNNPAQERIISLAYVSAPRMKKEGDEV